MRKGNPSRPPYVEHYNNVRLNSAIGYITPKHMLAGNQQEIQAERDRKLGDEGTAEESPPAGRVADETDYSGWPTTRESARPLNTASR